MTTQEYLKKEAEKFTGLNSNSYIYRGGYANGLSAGIELAKAFADWMARNNVFKYGDGHKHNKVFYTTSELFEIFLSERIN